MTINNNKPIFRTQTQENWDSDSTVSTYSASAYARHYDINRKACKPNTPSPIRGGVGPSAPRVRACMRVCEESRRWHSAHGRARPVSECKGAAVSLAQDAGRERRRGTNESGSGARRPSSRPRGRAYLCPGRSWTAAAGQRAGSGPEPALGRGFDAARPWREGTPGSSGPHRTFILCAHMWSVVL